MNGRDMRKTKIIAEMAWAHDGSIDKAINIMKAAKQAGADAIGIHITDMDTYMVHNYGSGKGKVSAGKEDLDIVEYLKRINPSHDQWELFADQAKKEKISLCVMANDFLSLEFCENKLNPQYYVISAAAFVEYEFVKAIAKTGKPAFLRIGGATLGEIEKTISIFRSMSDSDLVLLHGFQNYPTLLEETNIRQLTTLKNLFGLSVGLADHIDGADKLAKSIPMLAVACGASWIEKHITFDRSEKGEDFESALNPDDFAEFVQNIRDAETALGCEAWNDLSEATLSYRQVSRKRTVAAKDLPAGKKLGEEDFCFKRCDNGVKPDEAEYLLGRTLVSALKHDDPILWENIQ